MPIQFRCTHCGQLLSISRRKAGEVVTCPQCVHRTTVPRTEKGLEEDRDESAMHLEVVTGDGSAAAEEVAEKAWKERPNPWKAAADHEEEDFLLTSPELQESGLDMTPMVDVTFLLLIFFMITASFSLQKSLETTAPKKDEEGVAQAVSLEDLENASVVVEIDAENNIRVDDVPVIGLGELRDVLAAKIANENKTELLIESDAQALHGTVVAVTDAGLDVQMQRIRRSSKKGEQ